MINEYEISHVACIPVSSDTPAWVLPKIDNRELFQIDVTKFVSPIFYLEAIPYYSRAGTKARLYYIDPATGERVPIADSEVDTDVAEKRKRSKAFYLNGAYTYGVEVYAGWWHPLDKVYQSNDLMAIRVIVQTIFVYLDTLEHQIELVGTPAETLEATYQKLSRPIIIKHETAPYDGTLTAYFEATLWTDWELYDAYACLYDRTAGLVVAEVLSSSETPERVRTATPVTLTDGHEYEVRIKSEKKDHTIHINGAKLILEQTGAPITKTRNYRKVGKVWDWTGITYLRLYSQHYLHVDNLLPTSTFYYEAVFANKFSNICCSDLYDMTREKSIENSESCTPFGELEFLRYRSGALTLFPVRPPISFGDGLVWTQIPPVEIKDGEYVGRFKSDGEIAMMVNGYIIIDGKTV